MLSKLRKKREYVLNANRAGNSDVGFCRLSDAGGTHRIAAQARLTLSATAKSHGFSAGFFTVRESAVWFQSSFSWLPSNSTFFTPPAASKNRCPDC